MTKQNENYGVMKEIFNSIEGVDLHEKKSGRFYYTMHLTAKMEEADIEVLDLGVRVVILVTPGQHSCNIRTGFL